MNILENILKAIGTIFTLLILSNHSAFAQSNRFSFNYYSNHKGDTLPYRLLSPDYDTSHSFPLVIFLHGSGERGRDNEAQLKWGVMNFATDQMMLTHPSYLLAPQCPEKQSWSNFSKYKDSFNYVIKPQPSVPMELLIKLVKQLCKSERIDTNRIYITGVSMGGFGTFDAITRYPGLFAAAVPVCGAGDTSKATTIKHIPIWIYHGADDPAVSPAHTYNMNAALVKAGARPGVTIYPGIGHFSWLGAYIDPLMIEWLFQQHK